METQHICQAPFTALPGMREFYNAIGTIPTSTNADTALIRSHIAYWSGARCAERASIKPSRGHSYRIALYGAHDKSDTIVRINDHYDHRTGVIGYVDLA